MPRGIGLVLLDYDQAATTQRCLRSVAAGTRRPDEIVLIENGERSVDLGSDQTLAELPVHVIRPGANAGCAGGRNLGLDDLFRHSDVERFVLLDNDATVPPDFFQLAAEIPLAELEVAAPLVHDMDSGQVIYAGGSYKRHHVPEVISDWPAGSTEPRDVDWAPGAALVFNRETWLGVGSFDAWYEFLWEDVEWCYRARGLGAVIRVQPRLRVLHEAHQSSGGAFSPERLRLWSRNGTVFMFETFGWGSRLNWFFTEFRLIWGELRAGWRPSALGRLRGLGQGLLGVLQRKRDPAARRSRA